MLPVFTHPGAEYRTGHPLKIDVRSAGALAGDRGISLAVTISCIATPLEQREHCQILIKMCNENCDQTFFVILDDDTHAEATAELRFDTSAHATGLVHNHFWPLDGEPHKYLFVSADGMVRVYRDGSLMKEKKRVKRLGRCVWHMLVLGDTNSNALKSVSDIRIWDTVIGWDDAFYTGPKRKSEVLLEESAAKLRRMWDERLFTDAVVVCPEAPTTSPAREMLVHRAVLAASSPVLAAMFRTESMQEAQERKVIIANAAPEAVEALLYFCYLGEVPKECDFLTLLVLSDQYQIESLVKLCCHALVDAFSEATVVPTLRTMRQLRHHRSVSQAWEVLVKRVQASERLLSVALEEI